jgi:hypothetical protein
MALFNIKKDKEKIIMKKITMNIDQFKKYENGELTLREIKMQNNRLVKAIKEHKYTCASILVGTASVSAVAYNQIFEGYRSVVAYAEAYNYLLDALELFARDVSMYGTLAV